MLTNEKDSNDWGAEHDHPQNDAYYCGNCHSNPWSPGLVGGNELYDDVEGNEEAQNESAYEAAYFE